MICKICKKKIDTKDIKYTEALGIVHEQCFFLQSQITVKPTGVFKMKNTLSKALSKEEKLDIIEKNTIGEIDEEII